jgi:hypothetical protein
MGFLDSCADIGGCIVFGGLTRRWAIVVQRRSKKCLPTAKGHRIAAALLIAAPAAFAAPSASAETRAADVKQYCGDVKRAGRGQGLRQGALQRSVVGLPGGDRPSGRRRSARPARQTSSTTAPTSSRARERSRIASSRMPRRSATGARMLWPRRRPATSSACVHQRFSDPGSSDDHGRSLWCSTRRHRTRGRW